ncbi:MAG TPA: hypothetical protein VFY49_03080 [Myxococcota bacterium]|nr:hypothetical protein [Myxococcota bacterium]
MKAIFAAIGLACAVSNPASAQLATLDAGSAPAPMDALPAVGTPRAAVPHDDAKASLGECEEQMRGFRARNTQSPSRRKEALDLCLAAAEQRSRVEVAGP